MKCAIITPLKNIYIRKVAFRNYPYKRKWQEPSLSA